MQTVKSGDGDARPRRARRTVLFDMVSLCLSLCPLSSIPVHTAFPSLSHAIPSRPFVSDQTASSPAILTSLLGSQTVQAVIALSLVAHEAAQREVGGASHNHTAVLVDVGDRDLHRAVVLGLNQAASGSALARNVQVDEVTLWSGGSKGQYTIYVAVLISVEQRTRSFSMMGRVWWMRVDGQIDAPAMRRLASQRATGAVHTPRLPLLGERARARLRKTQSV